MLQKQQSKATALYPRLSRDDLVQGDSMSIQTQKTMLMQYAKQNGFSDCVFYVDDGYSGTNFDRPGFQQMLADIEQGKIGTVITKDLSRLGRDYLKTGYYIEVVFSEYNVRYIAINDSVDTGNGENNEFMPFKNIINEWYAKDGSRKVKSAYRT
ncbi:MAG TPA: recombinase, partial [Ruminococcaceae bacterium]|nr:recombinase [Oscillospiraceae bacterium]